MLLEVPHHLVELVLRDLSAGVSGPQDRVGVIAVSPGVPSATVPTPAPAAPPAHSPEEEEEQEEEDPAEAEGEEREETRASTRGPEGEHRQRSRDRDADHDEQDRESPADPATRMPPSGWTHGRTHVLPPPSALARKRSAILRMPSRCGPNFDASEVFKSSRYDTNPSISLNISATPCGRRRPTPGIHSNSSRTFGFSSYRPSSRFWTSPSCCSSARSG